MVAPPMRMALAKSLGSHQPAPQATMEVTRAIKAFQDGISMMRCDARATGSRRELAEDGRGGGGGNGLSQTARLVWTMGSMWQAKMDGWFRRHTEGNKRPNIHSRSLCESSITSIFRNV